MSTTGLRPRLADRLTGAYIVAWFLALGWLHPRGGIGAAITDLAYFGLGLLTVVLTRRAAAATADPAMARALRRLAMAHGYLALDGFVWTYWPVLFGHGLPDAIGHLADLVFAPLLAWSFLSFPSDEEVRWRDARVRVDAALFGVGLFALSWHFAIAPALARDIGGLRVPVQLLEWFAMVTGVVALLRARDRVVRRVVGFALTGHMLFVVTDYFWVTVGSAYAPGNWIDGLWFLAWILRWWSARKATQPAEAPGGPVRAVRGTVTSSLFVAAAYALVLLAFAVEGGRRSYDVAVAAVIMTVLLIVRQRISLAENERLADESARQAAVFRTLVASATDLVLLVRADLRIEYASPSTVRALGPVEGTPFDALLHHADRAGALAWLESRASSDGVQAYRCRLKVPGDRWSDIELRAQDRRDDPAVGGFVINARDVSQETALEQALGHSRKLAMLSDMAGRIAHSFNNTLAALQVHAEVLARDLPPGAPAREDARAIGAAAERGAGITRQLLGFSGRHVIDPVPLRPAQVIEALRPTFIQLLGGSRPSMVIDEAPDATVLLDRAQLEQVLVNLVANARDAMPSRGTVTFVVRTERVFGETVGRVVIEVTDQGTGIAEEHLERVFEPFFSTKAPGRGTGLGLAMVASIIRRAGGTVEIRSRQGEGTTVRLILPEHRAPSAPAPVAAAVEERTQATARVLLVDDDALVRRASSRMLARAGFEVVECEDGARALEIAADRAEGIDLLLTDLMMPGISGREVVARFRELRPGTPIICVTGYATERADDESLARSVSAIIAKPFTLATLQRAINEALHSARDSG